MLNILYIHGFLSSPLSYKAQSLQHWLAQHQPEIPFYCPLLTPYPDHCADALTTIVEPLLKKNQKVCLVGSSMGGFWATWLAEQHNLPAILINPAVDVTHLIPEYLGRDLQNYHTEDHYLLTEEHLAQLPKYDIPRIENHHCYWLFAQTADETLDYRLAVDKYYNCKQTIEPGGTHSFTDFDRYHQDSLNFFTHFWSQRSRL